MISGFLPEVRFVVIWTFQEHLRTHVERCTLSQDNSRVWGQWRDIGRGWIKLISKLWIYYRKRRSASYIVREVLSVREKITLRFSLHTSRLSLHGEVTIVAMKFAMSSHFPLPKFFSPSLFLLFQMPMARAARRVIEDPRQMIKSCPVLFCSSHRKNESN